MSLGLIRDDHAGTLTASLGSEIEGAHQLLEFAELFVDEFGFGRWREDFAAWRSHCGGMLRANFALEAAQEFYRGTFVPNLPAAQWRQRLRANVKAIDDMIQLLVTLRATLQGRGAPSH
jgi:hypothetical protein